MQSTEIRPLVTGHQNPIYLSIHPSKVAIRGSCVFYAALAIPTYPKYPEPSEICLDTRSYQDILYILWRAQALTQLRAPKVQQNTTPFEGDIRDH